MKARSAGNLGGPAGPPAGPARPELSGIRQRKILQKSLTGRPKHQTFLLDASKQAQVLVGALEAVQTQQQEMYQMVQADVQLFKSDQILVYKNVEPAIAQIKTPL